MNARGVLFALIVLSSVCLSLGFSDPVPGAYPKDTAGLASEAAREEERTLSGRDSEMSRVEEIAQRAREARERKAEGGDALASSTSLLDTTEGVKAEAGNPDAMGEDADSTANGADPTTLSVNPDDYAKDTKDAVKAPASPDADASAPATTLLSVGAAKGAFSAGAWNKIWNLRKSAKEAAKNPAPAAAAAAATNPEDALPVRPPIVPRADPAFPHSPLDGVQAAKLAENLRPAKPPKTSDLIPLLRYYSPELKDTVTTLDPRELHGDSRYIFQGAVCFMYASAAVPGEEVVPVYRYLDSKGKQGLVHYLSLSLAPRSPSDTAEGVAGFLYKDPQTGLVPLSEYFDPKDRDYLYSIASAKHIVKNGNQYIFQGVIGYVHTIRTPKDGNTYGGRLGGVLDHVPPAPTEITGAGSGTIDSAGVWHPPAPGTGSGAAKTDDVVDKRLPCKFDQTPEKDNCKPAEGSGAFTAASSAAASGSDSASAAAAAAGSAAAPASGEAAAAAAAASGSAAAAAASGSAAAAAAAEAPKPSALGAALGNALGDLAKTAGATAGAVHSASADSIAAAVAHTATDRPAGGFPAAGAGATGAVNAGQSAKLQLDLALSSSTVPEAHKEALAAAATNTAPVNPEPPKPEHEAYNPWAAARASGTPGTVPNVPDVIHPPIVNIDDLASKNLVPHPMDPDLVPMYRYWNPKMQDHYYTLDFANLGNGRDGWQYQGIQSYILKEEKEGAVPLYRYWNIRLADHYYTTDYDELKEGKDGYKYKGILGYVEKERKEGTVPLYEYFNADAGDHFYTDNFDFLKHGASGWKYVRVACYVWPHPSGAHSEQSAEQALEKDGQVELPLLVPLYRYWNIHMRDHFYTTLWKEVEVGTHGWEYQGVQALVYATQAPGTVAFHRYWNLHTLDHFYTTNFTMLEEGGKDGWVYEGIQCYVSPFRALNTIPLYGYFNENYRDHFYTTKHLGHQIHGWVLEGIQAYVWDTPLKNCSRPPTPSNVRFDGLNTGRQNIMSGFGASTGAQAVPGAINGADPRARSPVWPLAQPGQNPMGTYGGPLALNNNNGGFPALGIRHWGTTVYPATSPEVYPTPGSLAPSASVIGPANSFVPVDARDLGAIQGGRVRDPLQGAPASGVGPTFVPVVAPTPGGDNLAQAGTVQPSPISVRNSPVRPAANVFDATSFLSTAEGVTAEAHATAHAKARAEEPVRLPEDGRVTTGLNTAAPFLPPVDPRSVPAARTSLLEPSMRPPVITSIRTNPATMPDLAVKNPWHPTDTFLRPRSSTGKFKPKLVVPNKHELVPLYRYWNGLRKDHFYTTKTFSMKNWEFQGLVGYLYKNHKKGTVPLFRYFNRKAYDHFYTTKYRKQGDGDYKYQGIVGFVAVKSKVGMVPLYQYYNALFADHFYTGSWKHLGQGKAGWQYEGTQGYIFPPLRVHKALPFNAGSPDSWMGGETPVPLYAYYDAKETDHFYSTSGAFAESYDKFGKPTAGAKKNVKKVAVRGKQVTGKYRLLGIAGLIFLRQAPNTVPLHRYYNARANDHFYTTNWMTLQRGGKGGWKYEGIQGYVFAKHARGTVPLYRYYSKKNVDHMYTTKFEGMINKQGYKLQGIACYVRAFSGKMKNLPSWLAGVRRQPLYRYFNRKTNDHFYTTRVSLLGKDTTGRNGWIYQGVSAYLPVDAQAKVTTPLYVYFNTFSNDHFYTRNFSLLKRGGKFGWKFQGVEGLVYQTHQQGTVPFHRYYNTKVKDHYYTTDWSVLGSAGRNGWQYQGIEGYVFPPRSV